MFRPTMPLFVAMTGLIAISLSPSNAEAQQAAGAQVTFVNNTTGTVTINWVNDQNQEQQYRKVAAGKSFTQPSFVGHRWTVRNAQNQLIQLVTVDRVTQQAQIGEPRPASAPAAPAPPVPPSTFTPAPAVPTPRITGEPANSPAVAALLDAVNRKRAEANKPPLAIDDRISQLARDIVSKWTSGEIPNTSAAVRGERAVARAATLQGIFGTGAQIAENFQPTGTPNSVATTWMSHEAERNRMLGDFTLAGIGIVSSSDGQLNYGMIFVKPATGTLPTPVLPPPLIPPTVPPVVPPTVPPVVNPSAVPTTATVTLENKTAGTVRIFWVNAGVEEAAGQLSASQTIAATLPVGQQYVIRNAAGKELTRFKVTAAPATVTLAASGTILSPQTTLPSTNTLAGGKYTGMSREQLEADVVKEINLRRQQAGVGAVVLDERVSQIARSWSNDVSTSEERLNQIASIPGPRGPNLEPPGHWNMDERGKSLKALFGARSHFGENAMPSGTPESVVLNWMKSEGHKVNMLHPVPTLVGVGIGVRADGFLFYTAIFTKPQYPNGIVRAPLTGAGREELVQDATARLNAARTAKQLTSTFRTNAKLTAVAQQWADDIARRKVSSANSRGATNPNGPFDKSGYRWSKVSENAAVDVLAEDAVKGWIEQDAGEDQWILRATSTVEYGVGVARGDDGKVYWSIVLATPG